MGFYQQKHYDLAKESDVSNGLETENELCHQIKRAKQQNPQIVSVVVNPSIRAAVQQLAGQHALRIPILTTVEIPSGIKMHPGPELSITSHMPQPRPLHEQLVS